MRLPVLGGLLLALAGVLFLILRASAVEVEPRPDLAGTWRQIPGQDGKPATWDLPSEITVDAGTIAGGGVTREWTLVEPIPGAYGAAWTWADGERRACRVERVEDRILFWIGEHPKVYRKVP